MATIDILNYGEIGFQIPFMFDPEATHHGNAKTYVVTDAYGSELVFKGTDLTYNAHGKLIGGTLTDAFFYTPDGTKLAEISDFHLSGKALGGFTSDLDFYGALGDLTFNGADGGDYALGVGGNDTFYGGEGGDTLRGGAGDDVLSGGAGDDKLDPSVGSDVLDGGAGRDLVYLLSPASASGGYIYTVDLAAHGVQTVRADGVGADLTLKIAGVEDINGSNLADHLMGSNVANELIGASGDDLLDGRKGNDTIDGGAGTDTADYSSTLAAVVDLTRTDVQNTGKAGRDMLVSIENLIGGEGHNVFTGGDEANTFTGNGGDDVLVGAGGADVLSGGEGDDQLEGGAGADALAGGAGADRFLFRNAADASDVIYDFANAGDVIDLTRIDADTTRSGNQVFHFNGESGFHNQAGELVYDLVTNPQGVPVGVCLVYGDVDGDGAADFTITLGYRYTGLSAADFAL